jgi:hypothetical protein
MIERTFGGTTPIAPIPALAELRDMVLARSKKRRPKWRFRLAPDLVLQPSLRPPSRAWRASRPRRSSAATLTTPSGPKTSATPALQLRFPRCDLIGMNVELLRQLSQCSIALDGPQAPTFALKAGV